MDLHVPAVDRVGSVVEYHVLPNWEGALSKARSAANHSSLAGYVVPAVTGVRTSLYKKA